MEKIRIFEKPTLKAPVLVLGFGGWANGGEVSTGIVAYLIKQLGAKKFAEIDPEPFYVFTISRPETQIEEGMVLEHEMPTNEFFYWQNKKSAHDLLLFLGTEPNLRWQEFMNMFLDLAQEFKVVRSYNIGGFYNAIPHTSMPRVAAAYSDSRLKGELEKYDLQLTDYQGPTSIHTSFLTAFKERNIEAISLWSGTPHYIQVANHKAWYSILSKLTQMLDLELDLDDIKSRGEELDQQLDRALSQDPRLREYVRELEEHQEEAELREPLKTDEIIKSLEEFLKRRREGQKEE